jgi:preprotein translocase subunit YajC
MEKGLKTFDAMLALFPPRQTDPNVQPNPKGQLIQTVGMMVLMVVIFYVLLLRPQQKRAKEQSNLLKAVKPGDKILTSSGIIGVVLTVKETSLTVRSADTKLEITKSAIAQITERGGETSQS